MYELRDYQKEAVQKGIEFFNSDKKEGAIIVAPTASGKSILVAEIAKNIKGKTVVLQPSLEILNQNLEKAHALGITDIGVFSASAGRKDLGKVVFATIGTIISKKELFEDFDNLLADECHLINAKGGQYAELINHFGNKILGLTATPFRLHSYSDRFGNRAVVAKFLTRTRPRLFKEIIHVTQIGELYSQGYLCPIQYQTNDDYKHSEIRLNSTGLDYDQDALEKYNAGKGIIDKCIQAILNSDGKHILVFMASVAEAQELSKRLNEISISSATITGKTPKKERDRLLELFKLGAIKVATNCQCLTTGYDFPELDTLILARPTQSIALYMQMVGRVIRTHPNKDKAKIYDLCGNVNRFGKIENFQIEEIKPGLHRLKSDKNYLTGWDFISNQDIEATGYKGMKESAWNDHVVIMPFGVHKGKHISKLPNEYLAWCCKKFEKGVWADKFKAELARRNNSIKRSDALPF